MSDDVINLDSSEDESSSPLIKNSVAEKILRKCSQLNIRSIKGNKQPFSQKQSVPTKSLSSSTSSVLPIKSISIVGQTHIKPSDKTNKKSVLNNSTGGLNPRLNKIRNGASKSSFKSSQVHNLPSQHLPIKINSSFVPSNSKTNNSKNKSFRSIGMVEKPVIRNITNTPINSMNKKISPEVTITCGKVLQPNKRLGGNITLPSQKKQKTVPANFKKTLDSLVHSVAKLQNIDLTVVSKAPSNIPIVEIDSDDDDVSTVLSGNVELPIEYEPDSSKENHELDASQTPLQDPLEILTDSPVKETTESHIISEIQAQISIDSDDGDNSKLSEKSSHSNLEGIGEPPSKISSQTTLTISAPLDIEDKDFDEAPQPDNVPVLSKCDFYTPKKSLETPQKVKTDGDLNKEISKNIVKNLDKISGVMENIATEVKVVPVEVKVQLTPDDKKKVEQFEIERGKKRVVPFQLDKLEKPGKSMSESRPINSTYQRFIDLCFKLDSSSDMKKIVEKKVRAYYLCVHPSFTESKSFIKFVEGKVKDMTENPSRLFLYVKDVVDELKVRRVKHQEGPLPLVQKEQLSDEISSEDTDISDLDDEEDRALKNKIRKLERALRKLNRAIKRLQEKEVDCDDESSAYLLEDRYKVRLLRIYEKLCELTGERVHSSRRRSHALKGLSRLQLCGGRFPNLAVAVKAAAKSRPHWFPDYTDVLSCVEQCAKEQGLSLRQEDLQREARDAFVEIGTLLQQKRREAEYEDFACMMGTSVDPAEEDPKLAEALEKNKEIAKNREMEVINKFVDKQYKLNLVPEDVEDVDADKSDSSDDNSEEEVILPKETAVTEADNAVENEKNNPTVLPCEVTNVSKDDKADVDVTEKPCEVSDKADDGQKKVVDVMEVKESSVQKEKDAYNKTENNLSNVLKENVCKKIEQEENSNSGVSLVELISSDSRDSYNSAVEGQTEDTKQKENFQRLKKVRPSSVLSGMSLLKEDSSSLEMNDSDDNFGEQNKTVIENVNDSGSSKDNKNENEDVSIPTKTTKETLSLVENPTNEPEEIVTLVRDDPAETECAISEGENTLLQPEIVVEDDSEKTNDDCEETLISSCSVTEDVTIIDDNAMTNSIHDSAVEDSDNCLGIKLGSCVSLRGIESELIYDEIDVEEQHPIKEEIL